MASALQKLLRKSPSARIITAFNTLQTLNPLEPFPLYRSLFVDIHREPHRPTHPSTLATEHFISSHSAVIFPGFSFGSSLKPISATGFCLPCVEDADLDDGDSRAMWADSVKKKRKRKMNKHKYKKLRKRMRRKT